MITKFGINFCVYITVLISSLTFVQNWQQLVQLGITLNCIMWIRFSGYCATSRIHSKEDDLDEIGYNDKGKGMGRDRGKKDVLPGF